MDQKKGSSSALRKLQSAFAAIADARLRGELDADLTCASSLLLFQQCRNDGVVIA
jgi:hypothetical protein